MLTDAQLTPQQELCRSQGDSQTPMYVNKHHYMPASRHITFDANALITALARDIAFYANAVELADAGRQWCLFTYIGVSLSERYPARAATRTWPPGILKLDRHKPRLASRGD